MKIYQCLDTRFRDFINVFAENEMLAISDYCSKIDANATELPPEERIILVHDKKDTTGICKKFVIRTKMVPQYAIMMAG